MKQLSIYKTERHVLLLVLSSDSDFKIRATSKMRIPVTEEIEIRKNSIVLCKVRGSYYLHKVTVVRNGVSYQISNNHGHVNGWISKKCIYGLVVEIM